MVDLAGRRSKSIPSAPAKPVQAAHPVAVRRRSSLPAARPSIVATARPAAARRPAVDDDDARARPSATSRRAHQVPRSSAGGRFDGGPLRRVARDDADRAVGLEDGQADVLDAGQAMGADGGAHVLGIDLLLAQRLVEQAAVAHEQAWLALDDVAQPARTAASAT